MNLDGVPLEPWRLAPNRVSRFYTGGTLLERFRGASEASAHDGREPEDWVGSATPAWTPPGRAPTGEGLSTVETSAGERRLRDLLAADPASIAGPLLAERAGVTTGLLVKLLDAGIRLPVHAHPTRAFAREHLGSFFGKAEAWLIVGTRHVAGEEAPNLRLGLRHDLGPDELVAMIEGGDTDGLVAAMHERPARPGDLWFVPPGTLHAIGAGVFIIEIQEPSDLSVVAELRGVPIDPVDAHLGLGWDVAVGAIDIQGRTDVEIDALCQPTSLLLDRGGLRRMRLTGPEADPFFRVERVIVRGQARPDWEPAFLVGVVTQGSGVAHAGGGSLPVARGDTFAVPAAVLPDLELQSADGLELVACLPPRPWDLAAGADGEATT